MAQNLIIKQFLINDKHFHQNFYKNQLTIIKTTTGKRHIIGDSIDTTNTCLPGTSTKLSEKTFNKNFLRSHYLIPYYCN